jgi:hypothetical protein
LDRRHPFQRFVVLGSRKCPGSLPGPRREDPVTFGEWFRSPVATGLLGEPDARSRGESLAKSRRDRRAVCQRRDLLSKCGDQRSCAVTDSGPDLRSPRELFSLFLACDGASRDANPATNGSTARSDAPRRCSSTIRQGRTFSTVTRRRSLRSATSCRKRSGIDSSVVAERLREVNPRECLEPRVLGLIPR